MKIRTYVLSGFAVIFSLMAGTDKAGLTEGYRPGDLAPGIESLGMDRDILFPNRSGRYTLLHFWAAYDAPSRMLNVRLWNRLSLCPDPVDSLRIQLISVSFDEKESVFWGTVQTDRLGNTNQVYEKRGENSEVYKKYGLKKGLRNFLIDDKGVIVATDVTPEKLTEWISK
jgi:hypothetical protein